MRTSRFKPEEVLATLNEFQKGAPVREITVRAGISEATLYNWNVKYQGLDAGGIRRLRQLEKENCRLRRILGLKDLQIDVLKAELREAAAPDTSS